jgi:hypothetical protein
MRFEVTTSVLAVLVTSLDNVCHAEDPKKQRKEQNLNTDHLVPTDLDHAASLAHRRDKKEKVINDHTPIDSKNAHDDNAELKRNLQADTDSPRGIADAGLLNNAHDSNHVGSVRAGQIRDQNLRSLSGKRSGGMSGGGKASKGGGMSSKGGGSGGSKGGGPSQGAGGRNGNVVISFSSTMTKSFVGLSFQLQLDLIHLHQLQQALQLDLLHLHQLQQVLQNRLQLRRLGHCY